MAYDELPYGDAVDRAVRVMGDGYGEVALIRDGAGYWALYYFYWAQEPPRTALPHWVEGPFASADLLRPPFEMKRWLEENGYEEFLNDVD